MNKTPLLPLAWFLRSRHLTVHPAWPVARRVPSPHSGAQAPSCFSLSLFPAGAVLLSYSSCLGTLLTRLPLRGCRARGSSRRSFQAPGAPLRRLPPGDAPRLPGSRLAFSGPMGLSRRRDSSRPLPPPGHRTDSRQKRTGVLLWRRPTLVLELRLRGRLRGGTQPGLPSCSQGPAFGTRSAPPPSASLQLASASQKGADVQAHLEPRFLLLPPWRQPQILWLCCQRAYLWSHRTVYIFPYFKSCF